MTRGVPVPPATAAGVPIAYRADRVRTLDSLLAASGRLDRFAPARRDEPRGKVGQRREHEEA